MSEELTETHVEEPERDAPAPDELARLAAERDEYLALAQRAQADFENYRKRAVRDQERLVAHAHERLVRELLPILDDLERALEAGEQHEEATRGLADVLYAQAQQAAQAGAQTSGNGGSATDDEVVEDADFEVIDEEEATKS